MGLSDKHTTCQGSSQRGKESTCQRNAHALPNDTTGGQEARCTAVVNGFPVPLARFGDGLRDLRNTG
jgi:hypothetical protein